MDPGQASGDGHRPVVEELARLVLEQAAPEELVLFEETSAEYFADPERTLDPGRRDEALGFGLELAMLTPYVLAVATSCLGFLARTIAETATSETTKPVIGDLLDRLVRRKKPLAGTTPMLTTDQAAGVREVAFGRAKDLGLSEERARLLADAVVGGLHVAG